MEEFRAMLQRHQVTSISLHKQKTDRVNSYAHHFHCQTALRSVSLAIALSALSSTPILVSASDDGPKSSGTGFAVSRQGHILTNYHVVEGCGSIRATVEGVQKELAVVGTDARNDLAVLKLPGSIPSIARFREGRNIRPGDSVVLVGFPLPGLLASEANVTTGTVSALAGLGNDTRFLQMTAPAQPGNSGGPVLDQSGHIVGVVVSKLNALLIAKATGDIPQNINFAINGAVAKVFLDSHGVGYETAASAKKLEPAEVGAAAKQFTFLLECYSEKLGAEHRALEAERRALEVERRALESERQALVETRRRDQEARERARLSELEELEKGAKKKEKEGAERLAAEQQRLQRQRELVEVQAASERVILFHEEERVREAMEDAELRGLNEAYQALDKERHSLEEARRKGQEARVRALTEQGESTRTAKKEAEQKALSAERQTLERARRKGQEARARALRTPTSAFNLAYSDYLRGQYDLAVSSFQQYVKEFPHSSLAPNAHYWLGESYYQQEDYVRAIQAFEYFSLEYQKNDKIPAALYKLGLATARTGDLAKSKKSLKRVLKEFPTSDEAKLAKAKLDKIR